MKVKAKILPYSLLLLLMGLSAMALPDTTLAQQSDSTHTVQSGETLFSIARIYDLTVGDLRRWNDLDSDNLRTGQILNIAPPQTDDQIVHTVQSGETLFSISRNYGVTIAEIQQWNNLQDTNLSTGMELLIHPPDDTAQAETPEVPDITEMEQEEEERQSIVRRGGDSALSTFYVVRSGDSLYRIASMHGLSVDELMALNDLQSDMLRVGQQLVVPSDRSAAPSVAEGDESSTPQGRFAQYRVQSGESGESILDKFRMSRQELAALNPGLTMDRISSGQRITVLLPPTRSFENPYRSGSDMEDLGEVSVFKYSSNDIARPTTSGELYNPDQLTAAHPNISLGRVIYIENPSNNRGIYVKVNDRHSGEGLKLSDAAFQMLEFSSIERARVTIYTDN
jgi:LysM repeat protein